MADGWYTTPGSGNQQPNWGNQPNWGGQPSSNYGQPSHNFGQPTSGFSQPSNGVSPPVSAPQQFPSSFHTPSAANAYSPSGEEEDPPLLEELGIDVYAIWLRMQGIAFFKTVPPEIVQNVDMSGPILIIFALGTCLLLHGKLQFGVIYGFGMVGFVGMYGLINLMSRDSKIDLYSTISILGYGLLPVVLLAAIAICVSLTNTFGFVLSALCIFWCTATTSRFFETAVNMEHQRWLIAYPISLVYTCFVLITVF